MSTEHTYARLYVGNQNDHPYIIDRKPASSNDHPQHDADCEMVAKPFASRGATAEEIARRFVACWNACDGIQTEKLEKAADDRAPVFALLMETSAERDRLHAANVDLLQELKNIAEANPLNWDAPLNDTASFRAWAQSRAQAAISKHGGQS